MSENTYAIGVDVGGSRIKAGIVRYDGTVYYKVNVPTGKSGEEVVSQILKILSDLLEKFNENKSFEVSPKGIGLGVTGQVDFSTGTIIAGLEDKIPGWIGTPLKKIIGEKFDLPVLVDNDGKVAALAELYFGGHGEFKDMVCLTLGSGVGSGIIIDGKLHRPRRGAAGELGHIIINADELEVPGYYGRLESYVSSKALIRYALSELRKTKRGVLYEKLRGNAENITPELIKEAALMGDEVALKAIDKVAFYLGTGLATIAAFLAPDIIVLAGGLANFGDLLLTPTITYMKKYSFGVTARYTKVTISRLGDFSGVLGAAALIFHYM
ncbi:MAG: ROK family protein [Thermofilum sp.]|nr:ROK family protein [Thermofilum sp.]